MKKGGKLRKKAKWRPLTQRLYDKAWNVMSELVRRQSKGICFTCGARLRWQDLECGHFVHGRKDLLSQWYKAQCAICNKWKHGNLGVYATKLVYLYGKEAVQEYQKYKPPIKWTVHELEEIITLLKQELNGLRSNQ